MPGPTSNGPRDGSPAYRSVFSQDDRVDSPRQDIARTAAPGILDPYGADRRPRIWYSPPSGRTEDRGIARHNRKSRFCSHGNRAGYRTRSHVRTDYKATAAHAAAQRVGTVPFE